MQIRELKIAGAYEVTPRQFPDERGSFQEVFKAPAFREATGRDLEVQQANCSVSKAGVVRGIHFATIAPSQAKYVMCPHGAVLDFAIDIRVGSPTFGQWDAVLLDDVDRRAIFLSEGLGHCFVALEDDSTVVYLCSQGYNPGREFAINPTCPQVALDLPKTDRKGQPLQILLSEKDTAAGNLSQAADQGILPTLDQYLEFIDSLK